MNPTVILLIYVAYLAVMSVITFCMYGKDKKMSKGGTEVRIKEKTLLGLSTMGGAVGAFVGRIVFHHKTNKIYFSIVILLSLVLQVAVLGLMIYSVIA